jgi:hypothetical protein
VGSLRQAASKMRHSQPALSRSIREIEIETRVKLLELRIGLGTLISPMIAEACIDGSE